MNTPASHDLVLALHLSPRDTSTALALFYISYVLFGLPFKLVMSRLSPRVWMIRTVLVGTCFAAVDAAWNLRDLWQVLIDWRLWPLVLIYFGVVGLGIGIQLYGSVIISAIDPAFTGVKVSLLFAPIWMTDFFAILLVTPVSDRLHRYHAIFFSVAVCIQIAGLLNVTLQFLEQMRWPADGRLGPRRDSSIYMT